MNIFSTTSQYKTNDKEPVWRLMKDLQGNIVPMYEVHMPGVSENEWFNFYLYNTGFGTFWIIAHIPYLHEIADAVFEMYGINPIRYEFQKHLPHIVRGLDNAYDFELYSEEDQTYCINRFPDFDSNDSHEHWKVATICNIGKPLTMDFLENLTYSEKDAIKSKAIKLYWECCHIEDETKVKLPDSSKKIIDKEWNRFARQNNNISLALKNGLRILGIYI